MPRRFISKRVDFSPHHHDRHTDQLPNIKDLQHSHAAFRRMNILFIINETTKRRIQSFSFRQTPKGEGGKTQTPPMEQLCILLILKLMECVEKMHFWVKGAFPSLQGCQQHPGRSWISPGIIANLWTIWIAPDRAVKLQLAPGDLLLLQLLSR